MIEPFCYCIPWQYSLTCCKVTYLRLEATCCLIMFSTITVTNSNSRSVLSGSIFVFHWGISGICCMWKLVNFLKEVFSDKDWISLNPFSASYTACTIVTALVRAGTVEQSLKIWVLSGLSFLIPFLLMKNM